MNEDVCLLASKLSKWDTLRCCQWKIGD